MKQEAAAEALVIQREARAEREALDAQKAALEMTNNFRTKKTLLNVGGVRFETTLATLTSVPGSHLEAIASPLFTQLNPDADGAYYIDRNGAHFGHILSYLRDPGGFKLVGLSNTARPRNHNKYTDPRFISKHHPLPQ